MSTSHLRRDLESIPVQGAVRPYRIVIDDVAGRFARISEELWQRLARGDQDADIWSQAQAAGMTRQRTLPNSRKRFSFLAIRIPLGGIDSLARRLVRPSAVFFSATSIAFWSAIITVAFLIAISRSAELLASLGTLSQFLEQSNPVVLGAVFVITKVVHELGHAVMCRRMGARCGGIGILLLCGMPCPYCDVTNIWRQPSALRRAAVMLAGIYLELIIAALATFVWAFGADPALRWMALNLMVICGASTLLFNANPLMRYDGYFVLSDFLGSTNLRQESQAAFRGVVTRRIAGKAYLSEKKSDRRSCSLAAYHMASKAYRVLVTCTIAAVIIGVADWLHLRSLAISALVFFVVMAVTKNARRTAHALMGQSRWQNVSLMRRWFAVGFLVLFCIGVLVVPLPRYRPAHGMVDAANTLSVYLPEQQIVQQVAADYGQTVKVGDPLVRLQNEQHFLTTHRLNSQLRIAQLRGDLARREALKSSKNSQAKTADQWEMIQATEKAVSAQLASARIQLAKTDVRAEVAGTIIPAKPSIERDKHGATVTLRDRVGRSGETREAWCRISQDNTLHAALVIDAQDRSHIRVGSPVRIALTSQPGRIYASTVSSVSEIKNDDRLVVRSAAYQVLCKIPDCQTDERLLMIGQECHGVFQLPRRSFAADFADWLGGWIRG